MRFSARSLAVGLASTLLALGGFPLATVLPAGAVPPTAPTIFGLTTDNQLLMFRADAPSTLNGLVGITGVAGGETLRGIDVRPDTGELYAVGVLTGVANSPLTTYRITPTVTDGGTLTAAVAVAVGTTSDPVNGADVPAGYDFNPSSDRIRYMNSVDENARLDPDSGQRVDLPNDTDLNAFEVIAAAYSNNLAGATPTTLYAIDRGSNSLVTVGGLNGSPSPNTGSTNVVGGLNLALDPFSDGGFDIAPGGVAYAAVSRIAEPVRLYTINLGTGEATPVGPIGSAPIEIASIAVAVPAADLSVTKTVLDGTLAVGEQTTYQVTVRNQALVPPTAASAVVVSDQLPPALNFLSIAPGPFTCATPAPGTSGPLSCTLASLASGAEATFSYTVTAAAPGNAVNQAVVTHTRAPHQIPEDLSDNSASAPVLVTPSIDLVMDKTASDYDLAVGDQFTFTGTVRNLGPIDATDVRITDTLPAGITFLGLVLPLPAGTTCTTPPVGGSGAINCKVALLPAGASRSITATVRAAASGLFTNTAAATAPGFTERFPGDNTASASVSISPPFPPPPGPGAGAADLTVSKEASSTVEKGKKFALGIKVRNLGPTTAPVQVTERLSSKLTFRYIDFEDVEGDCDTPDYGKTGTISCVRTARSSTPSPRRPGRPPTSCPPPAGGDGRLLEPPAWQCRPGALTAYDAQPWPS